MPQSVLTFEDGIPGFPDAHHFRLKEVVDDGAFQVLEGVDDPSMALIVAVPWLFFPDYAPELSDIDQAGLGLETQEDAIVFCPVTLHPATGSASMNLLGPFIVNARTRQGRQVVLTDSDYELKAPLPIGIS
jgi:flagellar assembly factor FliW